MGFRAPSGMVSKLMILVVFGMSYGLASAQLCTPSTCPPGPVMARFEYENCTGEVTYQFLGLATSCAATGAGMSQQTVVHEDYVEARFWLSSGDCGATAGPQNYQGQRVSFGICSDMIARRRGEISGEFVPSFLHRDASMSMSSPAIMLPHVNASYESPQDQTPPTSSYPEFMGFTQNCASPGNCSEEGNTPFLWSTLFTNDTCSEADSSSRMENVTANTCYNLDGYYFRVRCIDESTYARDFMTGNGCQHIVHSEIHKSECGANPFLQTTYCTAEPLPPPAAPSSGGTPGEATPYEINPEGGIMPSNETTPSAVPTSQAVPSLTVTSLLLIIFVSTLASFMSL